MFCSKCGSELKEKENFCGNCGTNPQFQTSTAPVDFLKRKMEQAQAKFGGGGDTSAGASCDKCGATLIDGICPNCVAADAPPVDPDHKFKNQLFNPKEKMICILGNTYLQNYLSGSRIKQGFSVVSDKRVYFRGTAFELVSDKVHKTKVSTAVNIRDITGVNVTYISPIHYIIIGAILAVIGIVLAPFTAGIGLLIGWVLAALCFLRYFFKRVTLLKVQYAGGAIGFDVKWFSVEESLTYQKSIFLAKDKIFEDKE